MLMTIVLVLLTIPTLMAGTAITIVGATLVFLKSLVSG
jgi:hypothetical protein